MRKSVELRRISWVVPLIFMSLACLPLIVNVHQPPLLAPTYDNILDGGQEWNPSSSMIDAPPEIGIFDSLGLDIADVNGDGIDDIITHNTTEYIYPKGRTRGPDNLIILGRWDRNLANSTIIVINNVSNTFALGDVNGDGFEDIASYPYPSWNKYHYYPQISSPTELQIRFGSSTGPSTEPDQVISLNSRIVAEVEGDVVFCLCADIGDVNGDGYDDMVAVYRLADDIRDHVTLDAEMQVFHGSKEGLSKDPAWSEPMPSEFIENHRNIGGISPGDYNGDGYDDMLGFCGKGSSSASTIEVRYGSRDGISVDPDTVITASQRLQFVQWRQAPIDYDGDGYDDVGVHYYDNDAELSEDQINIYRGSEDGLANGPGKVWYDEFHDNPTLNWQRTVFTDFDADGLDEMVVVNTNRTDSGYKDEHGSTIMKSIVDLEYFYNEGGEYSKTPNSYKFDLGWEAPYPINTGDMDGDGSDDIIFLRGFGGLKRDDGPDIPATNRIWVVYGEGSRYKGEPVHFTGGPTVYAGLKAYPFHVTVDPANPTFCDEIRLTLDPTDTNVTFSWHHDRSSGSWFEPTSHEFAKVKSGPVVEFGPIDGKKWINFSILFDWDWPHEDPCDVMVEYLRDGVVKYNYTTEDLFRVENDLALIGPLSVRGEYQGPLSIGDWVRGGDLLTFSGPHVVYQGTKDVYPPAGACEIIVYDHDQNFVKVMNPEDGYVDIEFPVVNETVRIRYHMLAIQGLPGTAKGPAPMEFVVNVDADAPELGNPMPDGDEWISSNEIQIGVTADDDDKSGVDASTFEFSFRGSMGYGTWTRSHVEAGPDGPVVNATAFVELPDGEEYFLRWRVSDLVGNQAVLPYEIQLRIDTQNVTFTDPVPEEGAWNNATRLMVGITVRDLHGSGIDVSSVEYRTSGNNVSGYGPWTRYTGQHTDAREIEVRVFVDISDGPFNHIQWRAVDIAGNGPTVSRHVRILVDTSLITFGNFEPKGVQRADEVEATVSVDDGSGSGVDYGSIEYRHKSGNGRYTAWEHARIDTRLSGKVIDNIAYTFLVTTVVAVVDGLVEGRENYVQFRGLDRVGNGPAISEEYRLIVDSSGPQLSMLSPEEGTVHPEGDVTFMVRVADPISGVDIERVQYRYGTDGNASIGRWLRMPVSPTEDHYIGSVSVRFELGRDNRIQFQCFDELGNKALSKVYEVWVNQQPSALIVWPANGSEHIGSLGDSLSGQGSHDPDGDKLTYLWFIDGEAMPAEQDPELDVHLNPGVHEILLIVQDPYGGWSDHTITITVKEGSTGLKTGMTILFVIVVFVVTVSATIYLRSRSGKEP